jgi:ubiquinone/menaquinone biosynthesis C-methylase UbiE
MPEAERNMRSQMDLPRDEMHAYYDRRAPEFDDWWEGTGLFEGRNRPGWDEELLELRAVVTSLPAARVLDVGCGTGFVTHLLHATSLVALDQSASMLRLCQKRLPGTRLVRGDGLALPFLPRTFDRVFTSHVYGHVQPGERDRFLVESRRVAPELVIVDAGPRGGGPRDEWQDRKLNDGSRHRVYKRFFTGRSLQDELDGGRVLHDGVWFVAVASP